MAEETSATDNESSTPKPQEEIQKRDYVRYPEDYRDKQFILDKLRYEAAANRPTHYIKDAATGAVNLLTEPTSPVALAAGYINYEFAQQHDFTPLYMSPEIVHNLGNLNQHKVNYGAKTNWEDLYFVKKFKQINKDTTINPDSLNHSLAAFNIGMYGIGGAVEFGATGGGFAYSKILQAALTKPAAKFIASGLAKMGVDVAASKAISNVGAFVGTEGIALSAFETTNNDLYAAATGSEYEHPRESIKRAGTYATVGFGLGAAGVGGIVFALPALKKVGNRWVHDLVQPIAEKIRVKRAAKDVEEAAKQTTPKTAAEEDVTDRVGGFKAQVLSEDDMGNAAASSAITRTGTDVPNAVSFYKKKAAINTKKILEKDVEGLTAYRTITEEKLIADKAERNDLIIQLAKLTPDEIAQIPAYHLAKLRTLAGRAWDTALHNHVELAQLIQKIKDNYPNTGVYKKLDTYLKYDKASLNKAQRAEHEANIERASDIDKEIEALDKTLANPKLNITKEHRAKLEKRLERLASVSEKGEHAPTKIAERLYKLDDDIKEFTRHKHSLDILLDNQFAHVSDADRETYMAWMHNKTPTSPDERPIPEIEKSTSLKAAETEKVYTGQEEEMIEQLQIGDLKNLTEEERKAADDGMKQFEKIAKSDQEITETGHGVIRCLTGVG